MNKIHALITKKQIDDLYHRRITTTALAKELGVSIGHLSRTYREKCTPSTHKSRSLEKKILRQTRKDYHLELARQILANKLSVQEAAQQARTPTRTIYRAMACLKTSS
jgi:AraC-like DNA-binding protein